MVKIPKTASDEKRRVVIVQRIVPHYRVAFFSALTDRLSDEGIRLTVVFGQEILGTVPESISVNEPWAVQIKNRYIRIFSRYLVLQPCLKYLTKSDLVIIEHANSLLCNYVILAARQFLRKRRVAFWGHGRNLQSANPNGLLERFKQRISRKADWWFAYTKQSAKIISATGFPEKKITTVQNTVDVKELARAAKAVTVEQTDTIKKRLGIESTNICIYCGGFNRNKNLEFLIESSLLIKQRIEDFVLLFIGSGPDAVIVDRACRKYNWMYNIGPIFGTERAPYFAVSKATLIPGAIGLVITDSFVTQTPLFTTNNPFHGPEFSYLKPGENGSISKNSTKDYSESVIKYLNSSSMQGRLEQGCVNSANELTLDAMVENFASGILFCLNS